MAQRAPSIARQTHRGKSWGRGRARPVEASPYESRGFLLTPGELAFYKVLRNAVGSTCSIALKVRLADLLHCPDDLWDTRHGRKISQKHIDFVLYDSASTAIVLAVELDDRSHELRHRRLRDRFVDRALRSAGLRVLRVKAAASYDVARMRLMLDRRMHRPATGLSRF